MNLIVLWSTLHIEAAVRQLAGEGFPIPPKDVARLSPLMFDYVNLLGRYAFAAPQLSKLLKRRAAIEPVIGHTKHDHGMNRNYLLEKVGDRINALLSGCAWHLKKLWRYFVAHPLPVPTT